MIEQQHETLLLHAGRQRLRATQERMKETKKETRKERKEEFTYSGEYGIMHTRPRVSTSG
jgi:hypothetical protein